MFFPYVDDETRKILHTAMVEAKDLDEFSDLLCSKALSEDTPVLVQYLNFYFAIFLLDTHLLFYG